MRKSFVLVIWNLYDMNSGKLVIIVIPSILALVFSIFVTIGIMADLADRAEKAKQLKQKRDNIAILMPPPPMSSPLKSKSSSPLNPQITVK